MLAGACKDDGGNKVVQLLEGREGGRDAMVCVSSSDGISVIMQIFDPVLQLIVLQTTFDEEYGMKVVVEPAGIWDKLFSAELSFMSKTNPVDPFQDE